MMFDLTKLKAISEPPKETGDWFSKAEEGVDYLISQLGEEETILFAFLQHSMVHAVLAPRDNLDPPDLDDLAHSDMLHGATWAFTYTSGGGEPDKVFLADPLHNPGCKSLLGGENLVVRRSFEMVDKGKTRTEISQKLVHSLNLYWQEEEQAYCRLDDNGDIEPIIKILDLEKATGRRQDILVTIKSKDLSRYMAVTNTGLVQKFDFTRTIADSFDGWSGNGRQKIRGRDAVYNHAVQGSASYVNGVIVSRTTLRVADLVKEHQSAWNLSDKKYAIFKAHDWKNNRKAELSCSPDALASYFELESPLPFEITPAFFRPDVLQRYKSDPEKYTLGPRFISSRAGWSLQTYDINDAGQVHTYLRYLGQLPYQEQLYWQAFNEWPKAPISKRAFQTDIEGDWSDFPDPLNELLAEVARLDKAMPDWWLPRGKELMKRTHYPVTTSIEEWGNSIMAFDQLLVEGFSQKAVRTRLDRAGVHYEKDWGALKLIQGLLTANGYTQSDATDVMKPLRELHFLRSKVKGHSSGSQREEIIKSARSEHGSLKDHFLQLAFDCQEAFAKVCAALSAT